MRFRSRTREQFRPEIALTAAPADVRHGGAARFTRGVKRRSGRLDRKKSAYAPITAPLPSLPDVKISATGCVGLFCRDAASGSTCGSGRQRHRRCIPAVKQLFLSACLRKAKPLFFSKPGLCQRGRSPSMIISGGFSGTSPKVASGAEASEKPPENQPVTRRIAGTDAQILQRFC